MNEPIVALATPPISSALAVIRISGDKTFEIVESIFSKKIDHKSRQIYYGDIVDNGELIDEVVLNAYVEPHSYTGENLIEIFCHGSMLIANQIIEILLSRGCRLATRGEFTMRAFYHNKIDLIQAESINDVINATTNESKNLSLMSLKGESSSLLLPIKTELADLIANIEVNIDYPEYKDIEEVTIDKIENVSKRMISRIQELIDEGKQGRIIKEGLKVAIVGKPNVGKSSLLNALLHENKAIVTDIAGTTRDIVEGTININGIILHLFDTAGIRESNDKIEQIGIDKAKEIVEECDFAILVLDASLEEDDEDLKLREMIKDKKSIVVYNKVDITNCGKNDGVLISAKNGEINNLLEEINRLVGLEDASFVRPSLNNERQIGLLEKMLKDLNSALFDIQSGLPIDLISIHILDAFNTIKELLGEGDCQDLTGEIFSRFCVGK